MKKNINHRILCISMLLIFTLTFLGCSKSAVSAEQTAKAFYDLIILQDNTEFQNLGVADNELTQLAESQKNLMKEAVKSNFVQAYLPITDEQLESIYQSEIEALRKLSPTIELVSHDKEMSQVKISTPYIDMMGADTKAAEDTFAEVLNNQISDKAEISELYINKLIENIKALTPSTEVKENTFEFEKVNMELNKKVAEVWVPKEPFSFGATLGNMSVGNN